MPAATEPCGRVWRLALALALTAAAAPAHAQGTFSRGEALYANHCVTCHTCKAHTRRDPIVRNLEELGQQVDRWQATQKLGWTSDDRAAVVDYLNHTFYKF